MALAPKRACTYPGCGRTTTGTRCPLHAKAPKRDYKAEAKWRGKTAERGYGSEWRTVRDWHIKIHPLCVKCAERGVIRPGEDVDHIRPFDGLRDPLRLDPDNLQTLCRRCHNRKTARQ